MGTSEGKTSHTAQMIGSLIVAVLIVLLTISVITARLGPDEDSGGGSDSRDDYESGRAGARAEVAATWVSQGTASLLK